MEVTLGISDPFLNVGEKAVAQNSSSQDETVSRNSNNGFKIYMGKDHTTANTEVLSVVAQRPQMSSPSPVRHPGQPIHEVVFALPLRNDGKIWSGKVTFSASKPIELEVLHPYEPEVTLILYMESLIMWC